MALTGAETLDFKAGLQQLVAGGDLGYFQV